MILKEFHQKLKILNRRRIHKGRHKRRLLRLSDNLARTPIVTEYGFKFIDEAGYIGREQWEPGCRKFVWKLLPKVDLFVNVGANSGFYTCMAQKLCVNTLALEPEPINCQFLCKNLEINNFTRQSEVFPMAAGYPPPRITKIFGTRDTASLSKQFRAESSNKQYIPVVCLDDLVLSHRWATGQILALVDVEGWEKEVLAGSIKLLDRNPKPIWIIEILPDELANGIDTRQTFSKMFSLGYSAYRITELRGVVEVKATAISEHLSASCEDGEWNYLFLDGDVVSLD